MLLVGLVIQRLAGLRVELLTCPAADKAVELDIRRIQLRLAWLQHVVQTIDQSGYLVAIQVAVVIIQIVKIRFPLVLGLIVASLDAPHVRPMR